MNSKQNLKLIYDKYVAELETGKSFGEEEHGKYFDAIAATGGKQYVSKSEEYGLIVYIVTMVRGNEEISTASLSCTIDNNDNCLIVVYRKNSKIVCGANFLCMPCSESEIGKKYSRQSQ